MPEKPAPNYRPPRKVWFKTECEVNNIDGNLNSIERQGGNLQQILHYRQGFVLIIWFTINPQN